MTLRFSPADVGRKAALVLALVVCTAGLAFCLQSGDDSAMDDFTVSDNSQIRQLVHILSGAYENALLHGSSRADLGASDVLLETASIQFSSRALQELKEGSCGSDEDAGPPLNACALADPSLALGDWTEMLSYAAYRLENLARSASTVDGPDAGQAVLTERIEAMEHLYRMVFSVSKIYLDQTQSHAYLDGAQEQLRLARSHIETERNLCECDSAAYAGRLLELSKLNEQINDMRSAVLP
ncbi:MAG: hypothetical protein WA609_14375 [Terriglobales bacterium]